MRILATDTKSRHEQECVHAIIRILFSPATVVECIVRIYWRKKLGRH